MGIGAAVLSMSLSSLVSISASPSLSITLLLVLGAGASSSSSFLCGAGVLFRLSCRWSWGMALALPVIGRCAMGLYLADSDTCLLGCLFGIDESDVCMPRMDGVPGASCVGLVLACSLNLALMSI